MTDTFVHVPGQLSLDSLPHNGTATSRDSAKAVQPSQARFLDTLDAWFGTHSPAACWQAERAFPTRTHQSVSARINGLVKAGALVETGDVSVSPDTGRKQRTLRWVAHGQRQPLPEPRSWRDAVLAVCPDQMAAIEAWMTR